GLAPVFLGSRAHRRLQPGIEPARLDAQAPAHRTDGKLTPMLGHERVSHFASLAKYAVAFFRMSRSSDTRTSSRFSRRISASFAVSPDTAFANLRFQA